MLNEVTSVVDGHRVDLNSLTDSVIGAAIKVHKELGPGLLEGLYEKCLVYELEKKGLKVERQVPVEVYYDNVKMDVGFRIDILVGKCLVVELKTVEYLMPIHKAQLATYLRLVKQKVGLLLNFNVMAMKNGIKRVLV